jgi:alkenylglycerophosphocholine/alkenylglycerophosphoethanolamine hydrolase
MGVPVAVYVVAIGAMVASALVTPARPGWTAGPSTLAIVGALLFMTSDALIGWTRFVGPLHRAPVTIMVTYHLGQAALVLALVGT